MHDHVAEQNVLGCICLMGQASPNLDEAFDELTAEHFTTEQNKSSFLALAAGYKKYAKTDLVTVYETGGNEVMAYLSDLSRNSITSSFTSAVSRIKGLLKVRQLQNLSNQMNQILCSSGSATEKLEQVQGLIATADTAVGSEVHAKHIHEVSCDWLEHIDNMYENRDKYITPTGIQALDDMWWGGCNNTDLIVIGARPKMGKTELLCKLVEYQGFERKKPVYLASLEMTDQQAVARMVTNRARVSRSSIIKGVDTEESARLGMVIDDAAEAPIYIDDRGGLSVSQIRAQSRAIRAKCGDIGMVAVDYLGLMDIAQESDRHDLNVGKVTRALKNLAKELNCPVVLLSQLSRKCEDRNPPRPKNSDLINSGSIEADADRIILLYCEGVYHPDYEFPTVRELINSANRHGEMGSVFQDMTPHGFEDFDGQRIIDAADRKAKEDAAAKEKAAAGKKRYAKGF